MIKIEELEFLYNRGTTAEIKALAGIDAVIHKGEFVAVLGHNGCGKSTLAQHLNALLLPTSGKVTVDGMDTADRQNTWNIRKKCGMVFQNPDSQMVATVVEEEVAFGPENLGVPPEQIRERVDKALQAVGIGEMAKASSNHLSGGQKQRLAIAGIVAMHPEYIVLDESTSMLDPLGRREVLDVVQKLNREDGVTIIYITHSMEEAIQADRVIVMEEGKIVMEGTPGEIFSRVEKMRELKLDVPPMANLAHLLKKEGIEVPQEILTIPEMVEFLTSLLNGHSE